MTKAGRYETSGEGYGIDNSVGTDKKRGGNEEEENLDFRYRNNPRLSQSGHFGLIIEHDNPKCH